MEKCDKCGQTYSLHTLEEKLVRLACACESVKKCFKGACQNPVTQAELITGAPTIVKSLRCDEHGFEELRKPPVVIASAIVLTPPAVQPLTQTVAENCFVVVEMAVAAVAVAAGEVEDCYKLTSRCAPAMTMVTCVKCSDSHTLRSRTPVVVVDSATNIGLHRTVCPKCDESALFVIAPSRA